MQTIPLGGTLISTTVNSSIPSLNFKNQKTFSKISPHPRSGQYFTSIWPKKWERKISTIRLIHYARKWETLQVNKARRSGRKYWASQVAELFPTVSPEIFVREARLEDCWEVAETRCSSFFPEYSFPLDFVLRIDRLIGMLFGFSIPNGCKRTCVVAVIESSDEDAFNLGSENTKIGGFDGKFSLNKGYVAGILTVDTVADFLPRKGPLRQRRMGIAYISNVAVRERYRRKGIAKRLIAKAEAKARSWGCRAIALHCDLNNPGASKLYKGQGFKCIKLPENTNWPQPKTSPDVQFFFMMKLLNSQTGSQVI